MGKSLVSCRGVNGSCRHRFVFAGVGDAGSSARSCIPAWTSSRPAQRDRTSFARPAGKSGRSASRPEPLVAVVANRRKVSLLPQRLELPSARSSRTVTIGWLPVRPEG